jgi:GTP pyrophosphokinase
MESIIDKILANTRFSDKDRNLIRKAFLVAVTAHRGQKRLSGEDYVSHPVQVAFFLSELGLDAGTISAGLLHDVLEDTDIKEKELENEFGREILFLVKGVTKLSKIEYAENPDREKSRNREHIDSLKKMFFAMAEDIRVILIKLGDRYHNMKTLAHLPPEKQKRIALETLEIYAPIAARLGIGRIKGQLEDLAFPYVYPTEYKWLIKKVKERYTDRMEYIERTKPLLKRYLKDAKVEVVDIHSRAKHYYSLYQKLVSKDKDVDKVFDLVAMRVIVPDIKSCYEAMGVIHEHYKPLPGLIKDYIALPKPNGYQSLHTTIFCEKGRIVEIQIRTPDMHYHAENGIAAHWAYSENRKKPTTANPKDIEWVKQLKNLLSETTLSGEGLSNLKIDFFKNRIFALTPKGEVKDLPEGATPIDFAYSIHTELGNTVSGAKVNGKMVNLSYELKNGDVVEIIKSRTAHPSLDWLKVVKTAEAKKKIKSFLKEDTETKEEKSEPIKTRKINKVVTPSRINAEPIIQGQTGLMYKISKCCNPKPGDKITGYITLSRGVSIHQIHCANLKSPKDHRRILQVNWSSAKKNN